MIFTEVIKVPVVGGEQDRRSYVYVPDFAEEDHEARFPVLYMFDGQNVFFDSDATYGKSWGMLDYLEATGIPVIVAAVECNDGPNNERLSEYSPFDFYEAGFGSVTGRGKETMEWYAGVFKPWVDSEFPTIPDRTHTMIAGSSMGGLMSLYALMEYNHIYSKAAALSPSISFSPGSVRHMIKDAVIDPDTTLYMDCGEREFGRHRHSDTIMGHFADVTTLLLKKRVRLTSRVVPDGTHTEASWERQISIFMDTILYPIEDEL